MAVLGSLLFPSHQLAALLYLFLGLCHIPFSILDFFSPLGPESQACCLSVHQKSKNYRISSIGTIYIFFFILPRGLILYSQFRWRGVSVVGCTSKQNYFLSLCGFVGFHILSMPFPFSHLALSVCTVSIIHCTLANELSQAFIHECYLYATGWIVTTVFFQQQDQIKPLSSRL